MDIYSDLSPFAKNILLKKDTILVGAFLGKYFIFQNDKVLEEAINLCFGKMSDDKFFDFLRCAIYNDKVIVFQLMERNNYNYDKTYFKQLAFTWKSSKCIDFFIK